MAIVRCWVEDSGPDGFRVRVTVVRDVATGQADEQYFAEPDAALEAVRRLLNSVVDG